MRGKEREAKQLETKKDLRERREVVGRGCKNRLLKRSVNGP